MNLAIFSKFTDFIPSPTEILDLLYEKNLTLVGLKTWFLGLVCAVGSILCTVKIFSDFW